MSGDAGPWRVERDRGPAERLHHGSLAGIESRARLVRILEVDRPALVLGSGQHESDLDAGAVARAGVDVVHRRSGGGAVLVEPAGVLWIDLVVPAGDPLWDHDVRRAAWWVGEAWATACDQVGAGPAGVWKGGLQASAWSSLVCFAGVGPGEVRVGPRKVVGVAQRRTRHAVLFQTAALLRWEPGAVLALLRLDDLARADALADLEARAAGVGPERAEALAEALLAVLPGPTAARPSG